MDSQQLPLTIGLKDHATFASYFSSINRETVAYLQRLTGDPWEPNVYLWGPSGTGKSHLLQAICHAAGERGESAIYLPMGETGQFSYEALDGIENVTIVCIDDIHVVAGNREWETALIRLFDRIEEKRGGLVITGNGTPTQMELLLPQLVSRLTASLVLVLNPLEPTEQLQALQLRANRRGLALSDAAGRYLMRHFQQDTNALFAALDTLDKASLAAKRKLTPAFLRSVLEPFPVDRTRR
jgi:DnaA family protein